MRMQALQVLGLISRYRSRIDIDSYTLVCLLQGCINRGAFDEGKVIHSHIVKTGSQHNVFVWTALADMYAKYGYMEDATKVFDMMPERNLVSWNVLIAGYVKHGLVSTASSLFQQMLSKGMSPDIATIISMIQASIATKDIEEGKLLHSYVLLHGFDSNILLDNVLIDMYGKCGRLDDAREIFDTMPRKDSVSWNAMISGCALLGLSELCLSLFYKMLQDIMPDDASFLCIISVCASLGSLDQGRNIHLMIAKTRAELTIDMANAIIDMYGKCGNIESAFQVFISMRERDCVSWNAMIAGLSQSGFGRQALELLLEMETGGVKMSHITFLGSLSACSHAGLVEFGCLLSTIMMEGGGDVMPVQEHHAGLIDLLGRAGLLEDAFNVIHRSPFQPSSAAWRTLLSACRTHNDLEKIQLAAECLLDLEPQSDAVHLLLCNAYAAGRYMARLDEAEWTLHADS